MRRRCPYLQRQVGPDLAAGELPLTGAMNTRVSLTHLTVDVWGVLDGMVLTHKASGTLGPSVLLLCYLQGSP